MIPSRLFEADFLITSFLGGFTEMTEPGFVPSNTMLVSSKHRYTPSTCQLLVCLGHCPILLCLTLYFLSYPGIL